MNESVTRDIRSAALPRALARFAPETTVAEIAALLDKYHAWIVGRVVRSCFNSS